MTNEFEVNHKTAPANSNPLPESDAMESQLSEINDLIASSNASNDLMGLSEIEVQYRSCLMENISEGVIFVDHEKNITCWNRSAEIITGLTSASMMGIEFTPELLGLIGRDEYQELECPVGECITSKKQSTSEFRLRGRSGREVEVELTLVPVVHSQQCHGCVVLMKDLSANADLKQQLSSLQNANSMDPLTKVANRAEFEKQLREYVKSHRAAKSKCCLIVCDIDYFKMVNDTYGHNIGDQALIVFAQALKKFTRTRDIVARYGGEEFVILCANCDIENAAERAEQIRMSLNRTPQQMLDGKTLSASFGVSEMKDDEDVTDFFVRADKALYTAKQSGRNRVEKAADELKQEEPKQKKFETSQCTGVRWRKLSAGSLFCEEFKTSTPSTLLAEKLRGFITETESKILNIEPNYASVTTLGIDPYNTSRKTHFRVDVEFFEPEQQDGNQKETYIRITVFPPRQRLFRRVHEYLHSRIVTDLRRYLMITDENAAIQLNLAATSSGRDEA